MNGKTHLAGGLLVAGVLSIVRPELPGLAFADPVSSICSVACIGFGSLLPDVDLPTSTMGQKFGFVSLLINKIFGHRGFTHSLLPTAILLTLTYLYSPLWLPVIVPLAIGILSHVFLDLFNKAGVRIAWPLKVNMHIAHIEMDSKFGIIFSKAVMVCAYVIWILAVSLRVMDKYNITVPALITMVSGI